MAIISAPKEWIESVSRLRIPARADERLQQLMDRNNDGLLTENERAEMESLVETSEQLSLVRAEALHLTTPPALPRESITALKPEFNQASIESS